MEEDTTIYICEGTCKGEKSSSIVTGEQEEIPKCGDSECTKYDKPMIRFHVCKKCSNRYKEGEEHICK